MTLLSFLNTPGGDWNWRDVAAVAAIVAGGVLMWWAELALRTGGFN